MKSNKIILSLFFSALNGLACALILKCELGTPAYDSIYTSLSYLTNIKVGTLSIVLNALFIFGQIFILRKNYKPIYLLQFVPILIFGSIVNFFYYDILRFEMTNYLIKLIVLVLSYTVSALAVAVVVKCNVISFPLEAFCNVVADHSKFSFTVLRQGIDIFGIVFSLIVCVVFKLTLTVREGTIIGMLIYAPLMDYFIQKLKKWIKD